MTKTEEKYKHDKSVTSVVKNLPNGESVVEKDKYGRTTYEKDSGGFWMLKFYDEPLNPNRVNHTPYQVVHKYWSNYND